MSSWERVWSFPLRDGGGSTAIRDEDLRNILKQNGFDLVERKPEPPLMPEAARRALASFILPKAIPGQDNVGTNGADHIATRLAVYGFKIVESEAPVPPPKPRLAPQPLMSAEARHALADLTLPIGLRGDNNEPHYVTQIGNEAADTVAACLAHHGFKIVKDGDAVRVLSVIDASRLRRCIGVALIDATRGNYIDGAAQIIDAIKAAGFLVVNAKCAS